MWSLPFILLLLSPFLLQAGDLRAIEDVRLVPADWESLSAERRDQRRDENEEKIALAIIEGRPYQKTEDLLRVSGIGPKSLENFSPWLKIEE